jgi:hypothetical protein
VPADQPPAAGLGLLSPMAIELGYLFSDARSGVRVTPKDREMAALAEQIALKYATPPAQGEGVVVPREPTEAMLSAGASKQDAFYGTKGPYPRTRAIWNAMLSAAPLPPEREEGEATQWLISDAMLERLLQFLIDCMDAKAKLPKGAEQPAALYNALEAEMEPAALQPSPVAGGGEPDLPADWQEKIAGAQVAGGGEAEPVAWRWRVVGADEWALRMDRPDFDGRADLEFEPLFVAPPTTEPQAPVLPDREAIARLVHLHTGRCFPREVSATAHVEGEKLTDAILALISNPEGGK